MDDNRLGAILLEGGVVDETGLERCLAIQALTGTTRPVGRILVEQGLLDEQTLKRLLALQQHRSELRAASTSPQDLGCAAIITAAAASGACEVVVSEGRPVRVKVGDAWQQLTEDELSGPEVWDFVRATMGADVLEQLAERHFVVRPFDLDGELCGSATAFRQFEGVAVRLSFAPSAAASPDELGVPASVVDAVHQGRGLVLCVGERAVGRADLLAAMTREAAREEGDYVVVVADEPIPLPTTGALVTQRRLGDSPAARADVLRSVVREDPDALVVADVGDVESFEVALRAAEGGRLVVAYIDAPGVVAALTRVLDFYPPHELPRVRASLAAVLRVALLRLQLPDAAGQGAVTATELLRLDDAAREVVRDGELADLDLLLRDGGGATGHALDRSLLDLLRSGRVRLADVFARAQEKAWLLERTRDLDAHTPSDQEVG